MMHILVTGGAGYIGSHTVKLLLEVGYDVVVLDNLINGNVESVDRERVELVVGDISDEKLLTSIFTKFNISYVIHFAAFAYVGESVRQPIEYYENNFSKPLVLLEAMKKNGCHNIIFSSTCATYGEPECLPITEKTTQEPINPYGKSKLFFEHALKDSAVAWGLNFVALRYFNACGASLNGTIGESHDPETHILPLILEVALGVREQIKVFGDDYETEDGTCVRDYIHVEDLASAHVAALTYLLNGGESFCCNLGTGQGLSIKQLIEMVAEVTGKEITTSFEERRPGDPPILVADASLAQTKLKWVPKSSDIKTIVSSAWNWHQNRKY